MIELPVGAGRLVRRRGVTVARDVVIDAMLPFNFMAKLATVLRTDGTSMTEMFEDDPPLAWLKEQVGGYIELVPGQRHKVIVNEDAMMLALPENELAAARLGDVIGTVDGMLRGPVVIIEPVH